MSETGSVTFGSTAIPYTIVRSRRRKKTIEITLDPVDGVLVSTPLRVSPEEVKKFVERRARWIIRKSTAGVLNPAPKQFLSGESIPYLGRQVRMFVEYADVRRVTVKFDHWSFRIHVPGALRGEPRRAAILRGVTGWYRRRAADRLAGRVQFWAAKLGCDSPRVLTRDQRQRWGSCAADGTIRFNWRIVMAEPALIDYVVVHELLHLRIRNHAREFWSEMAGAMPDYKVRRVRLREFGKQIPM